MRITESQLRNIVRQEILRENVENRAAIAVLRKYNHPSARDKDSLDQFLNMASTAYHEFEISNPREFAREFEDDGTFGRPGQMPMEFYADLIAAMKKDESSYFKKKNSSYRPGYRD